MRIWVSSLARVVEVAEREAPGRAVSLLSPGDVFPEIACVTPDAHHRVHLHDIREEMDGYEAPGRAHVANLIGFLEDWEAEAPLLVHCWAGISRSTATAFIAACIANPDAEEAAIALALRDASPTAFPNTRIVAFADDLMGRRGRMTAAVDGMGRGVPAEEAEPFFIPARFGA